MHVKIRMSSYPVHYYFFLINADFIANLLPLISNLGKIHNYLGLVGSQNTTSRPEDIPEGGALLLCLRHRLACIK